jgi:hypothetical protein
VSWLDPALEDAALGAPQATDEALEVRAFVPSELPWQDLAFWSDERALRDHLSRTDDRRVTAGGC